MQFLHSVHSLQNPLSVFRYNRKRASGRSFRLRTQHVVSDHHSQTAILVHYDPTRIVIPTSYPAFLFRFIIYIQKSEILRTSRCGFFRWSAPARPARLRTGTTCQTVTGFAGLPAPCDHFPLADISWRLHALSRIKPGRNAN